MREFPPELDDDIRILLSEKIYRIIQNFKQEKILILAIGDVSNRIKNNLNRAGF
ncbi:MAG: hypothetical protein ACJZ03_00335 [Candidatus Neomarinimicrobiota bacterium]